MNHKKLSLIYTTAFLLLSSSLLMTNPLSAAANSDANTPSKEIAAGHGGGHDGGGHDGGGHGGGGRERGDNDREHGSYGDRGGDRGGHRNEWRNHDRDYGRYDGYRGGYGEGYYNGGAYFYNGDPSYSGAYYYSPDVTTVPYDSNYQDDTSYYSEQ